MGKETVRLECQTRQRCCRLLGHFRVAVVTMVLQQLAPHRRIVRGLHTYSNKCSLTVTMAVGQQQWQRPISTRTVQKGSSTRSHCSHGQGQAA